MIAATELSAALALIERLEHMESMRLPEYLRAAATLCELRELIERELQRVTTPTVSGPRP